MRAALRASLHVVGALVLCVDAAVNLVIHPLTARSLAITIALASLGSVLVIAEPSLRSSRMAQQGGKSWRSMLAKSALFLLAAVVLLDDLKGLPCASPRAPRKGKKGRAPAPVVQSPDPATLKTYGASVYLVRSLAPQCVQFLGPNLQGVPSMAWVNVSPRHTSRLLMLAGVASTLTVALVFGLLGIFQMARGGKAAAGKGNRDPEEDVGTSSQARTLQDMDFDRRIARSIGRSGPLTMEGRPGRPVDLLGELMAADKQNAPSNFGLLPNGRTCTSRLSAPASRCDDAASNRSCGASSVILSIRGEASTCAPALRQDHTHRDSPSCGLFGRSALPMPPPQAHSASSSPIAREPESPGLGYPSAYGGTVDFASGCIMHQPVFSRKRRGSSQQEASFPTLLPPDFSRPSFHSLPGLSPRRKVKSVPNGTGKGSKRSEAKARYASAKAAEVADGGKHNPPAVMSRMAEETGDTNETEASKQMHPCTDICAASTTRDAEDPAPQLPQAGPREQKSKAKPTKHDVAKHHLRPAQAQQAPLSTADSMRCNGSAAMTAGRAPTPRPGTGASVRSNGSLRLVRQSVFAALDVRLATRSSVVSHDASCGVASACSYDSQGGCSAGTFGDAAAADSPVPSPKLRFPRMPSPRSVPRNGMNTSPAQSPTTPKADAS